MRLNRRNLPRKSPHNSTLALPPFCSKMSRVMIQVQLDAPSNAAAKPPLQAASRLAQRHFYSTMTPSRNRYISMKTNDRCHFYSTMKPGVFMRFLVGVLLVFSSLAAAAPGAFSQSAPADDKLSITPQELAAELAKFKPVRIPFDQTALSDREKKMVRSSWTPPACSTSLLAPERSRRTEALPRT